MNKIIFIILAIASSIINCWSQVEIPAKLTDRPEQIIHHHGYTLSYNIQHNTPNWVAWILTKNHANGKEPRSNQFLPDPCVPYKYRVISSDYTGSGYDRGHMTPAADMSYSSQSMHDCFYMSNMCPQIPTLNRVSWKQLESKCRSWVLTEDTLYIVCGPVFGNSPNETIGHQHKIHVPNGFFKVILSLRENHSKAIGFYYLNSNVKQSIQATATTVNAIELLTGIDFFYSLDDIIEESLESSFKLNELE